MTGASLSTVDIALAAFSPSLKSLLFPLNVVTSLDARSRNPSSPVDVALAKMKPCNALLPVAVTIDSLRFAVKLTVAAV